MALLDRQREREILELLAKIYPHPGDPRSLAKQLTQLVSVDSPEFAAEIVYLQSHGLIEAVTKLVSSGPHGNPQLLVGSATIAARGMDFPQDDGGLSAILGVVIVRLHDDTIKTLLIDKVEASEGDPSAKGRLMDAIKSLPAEATKSVAMRLIERGLSAAPQKLAELQTLLDL